MMENKALIDNIGKYKLFEEEHKMVLEQLKEKLFTDKTHQNNPSIMFVVGQPGCGKTTYVESANLSNYIIINSDNYRKYHKCLKKYWINIQLIMQHLQILMLIYGEMNYFLMLYKVVILC